jgi:hypothetical protein
MGARRQRPAKLPNVRVDQGSWGSIAPRFSTIAKRPFGVLPWSGSCRRYDQNASQSWRSQNVLAAVHDPAVLEFQDDAAVEVQVLSVALGDVVMDADHAAVLVGEHALQIGAERAARLGHVAAETGEDGLPSDDFAGERAPAGGCAMRRCRRRAR